MGTQRSKLLQTKCFLRKRLVVLTELKVAQNFVAQNVSAKLSSRQIKMKTGLLLLTKKI